MNTRTAAPVSNKPWLFLDLDGVISPLPTEEMKEDIYHHDAGPPPGFMTWENALYNMYVSEHLGVWSTQLDQAFDVIWSSSWGELLIDSVAKPLGLDHWPVLQIPFSHAEGSTYAVGYKAAAIRQFVEQHPRPFEWCDDQLYTRPSYSWPIFDRTTPRELDGLTIPYLLIKPCAHVGLTQAHIEQLLEFAASRSSG